MVQVVGIRRQSGLALLLVVLVILLFAATMLVIQRGKSRIDQSGAQSAGAPASLSKIEAALKTFVAAQKRLPCPADPTKDQATDATAGAEVFTGTSATCSQAGGVIPWLTLGLNATDALDPWGRAVTYRVFNGVTGFTQTDGLNATNCNTSTYLTVAVAIDANGKCTAQYHESLYSDFLAGKGVIVNDRGTVVNGVAYVLISHGRTGYGSYDLSGKRSPLPNATSKEYPNTQVPMDNTYWKQDTSASTLAPDSATHFDDIVYYKSASDLLNDSGLAGRDWGTVAVDKAFFPTTITTGGSVTLTITLTNAVTSPVKLAVPLVDLLPQSPNSLRIAATPAASTTCASGTVTAIASTGTSVTLSAGAIIPARVDTTVGSCTVTVKVAPTQPVAIGAAAINYPNTIAAYALEVTPNLGAVTSPDAAAVRNIVASSTPVLTATAPPPIVTPSAGPNGTISPSTPQSVSLNSTVVFTVAPNGGYSAFVGGTCGGTQSGNTFTTNPITSDCTVVATFTSIPPPPLTQSLTSAALTAAGVAQSGGCVITGLNPVTVGTLTITAFASFAGPRVSASSSGIGVATSACGSTSLTGTDANNERLRFDPGSPGYSYVGVRFTGMRDNAGDPERATLSFYDSGGSLLTTKTLVACQNSSTVDSNFYIDVGQTFAYFDTAAILRPGGTTSSVRVGSLNFCTTAPASACVPPTGANPTVNCP